TEPARLRAAISVADQPQIANRALLRAVVRREVPVGVRAAPRRLLAGVVAGLHALRVAGAAPAAARLRRAGDAAAVVAGAEPLAAARPRRERAPRARALGGARRSPHGLALAARRAEPAAELRGTGLAGGELRARIAGLHEHRQERVVRVAGRR